MLAFLFKRRPDINAQNTGHEAFQRVLGLGPTYIMGNGGIGVMRSLNATNAATLMVGPTYKVNDPTVTGNVSGSPALQPLSDPNANLISAVTGNI